MFVNNIYDAISPILFTTALFGLSSVFTKTESKTRKIKIFNILKILNILYILLISYLVYFGLGDAKKQQLQANYASGVSKIGIIFHIVAQFSLLYIVYTVNTSQSPKVLSCIEDIKKIDEIFEDLGENINYRAHFTFEMSAILLGFFVILGRSILTHVYLRQKVFSTSDETYYIFTYPSWVSNLVQNNFLLLVKLLHERYSLVNKLLDNLKGEKIRQTFLKIKPSQEYQMKHGVKRIELMMELHDYLTDVGNKLNSAFTIQILTCLCSQFLTEVFGAFYLYYESLVLKNTVSSLIWLMWTLWTILETFYVSITCHITSKESRYTGIVIHKVLMVESEPCMKRKVTQTTARAKAIAGSVKGIVVSARAVVCQYIVLLGSVIKYLTRYLAQFLIHFNFQLMIFSQQVFHKPLQFTACGLFTIDCSLIFMMAGAAATYLLIMLQFQEGIEAQCSNVTMH